MSVQAVRTNGVLSPPPTEKAPSAGSTPPKVVLAGKTGRILCVADIRGDYHELNRLIREHEATAVIHTGDFGFMTAESVDRMGDKILRHLIQYSPLISPATRAQLLGLPPSSGRASLVEQLNNSSVHFPLSQFPHLLSGAINFPVPVFTVWGLIEDVKVLERFRTGEYEVQNLFIIDEATTKLVEIGGLKLRLFGLGGTVAPHKMFDNGDGFGTIAGGQGTMWTTALQMGELIDTAQRVYDPQETRLFVTSAPTSRTGLLSLIANALKADLTISGGLHFRYPVSFNEFSIHHDFDSYRQTLVTAANTFGSVYDTVKDKVDSILNEHQLSLLKKIVGAVADIPKDKENTTWTNTWHWVLSDASCGHMLLAITDSRVSAEIKTSGLNFAHRTGKAAPLPSAPQSSAVAAPLAAAARRSESDVLAPKPVAPTRAPLGPGGAPAKPGQPSGPSANVGAFKNGPGRPGVVPPKPSTPTSQGTATAPSGPTPGAPAASASAKPPAQPRGSRQNLLPNNQTLSGVPVGKEKPVEGSKSTILPTAVSKEKERAGPSAPPKVPTPTPNGKTPTAAADKSREDSKKVNASTNGDKVSNAAEPSESAKEGRPVQSREASGEIRPKRHSLYVKGLPDPTTEEEFKALFGAAKDKITLVKVIVDHINKKQKDFGYVEFATEEDMNEALKASQGTIRGTAVNVSISNPPARPSFAEGFRGRGGRGGSLRGGRGRGGFAAGGKREGGEGGERKESSGPAAGGDKKE